MRKYLISKEKDPVQILFEYLEKSIKKDDFFVNTTIQIADEDKLKDLDLARRMDNLENQSEIEEIVDIRPDDSVTRFNQYYNDSLQNLL